MKKHDKARIMEGDAKVTEETVNNEDRDTEKTVVPAADFYSAWRPFSAELRKIIKKESSQIPIVILGQSLGFEPRCDIGYVYDPQTGNFKGKIIAIFDAKKDDGTGQFPDWMID